MMARMYSKVPSPAAHTVSPLPPFTSKLVTAQVHPRRPQPLPRSPPTAGAAGRGTGTRRSGLRAGGLGSALPKALRLPVGLNLALQMGLPSYVDGDDGISFLVFYV